MKLRAKAALVVGGTMFALFVLLFGTAVVLLTSQYRQAEQQDARFFADRLVEAVVNESRNLDNLARASAARDDVYAFMRSRDGALLPREFNRDVTPSDGFSFAILLDSTGRAVLTQRVDIDLGQSVETPESLVQAIEAAANLRNRGDPHGAVGGLMTLPGGVAFVAAHSVTTADAYARPVGTLVLGRYLDASAIDDISTAIGLKVRSAGPAEAQPPPAVQASRTTDAGPGVSWWGPVNDSTFEVRTQFADLDGQPAVVLGTEFARGFRATMLSAIAFAGLSLFVVCLAATLTVLRLIDKFVIKRVADLSDQVDQIGQAGDASRRVEISGHDELGTLEGSVNEMLAELETAEDELVRSRDDLEERVLQRTHELSVSHARHRILLDSMADAVFSVDLDGRVALVNQRAEAATGRTKDELIGTRFIDLVTIDSVERVERHLSVPLASEAAWTVEAMLHSSGRPPMPVELRAAPFMDENGEIAGTQWIARDVAERQRFERQLVHLANHDALTDLANRRAFERALELEIAGALRDDEHGAVIWLDLDDFKDLNDTLGHAAGDEALVTLSAALSRNVRASNLLARVGGDEFAILMPRTSRSEADSAARRILNAIASCTCSIAGRSVRIGASVGVVFFPEDGESIQEILSNADAAMYRAKEGGRGRIYVSPETDVPEALHVSRLDWNERITLALKDGAFVAHAQPVLDIRSGEIVRHELLIRMCGEGGALYPPADFLPVAERLGFINEIDAWMVVHAISILKEDRTDLRAVEVNLSGKAFAGTNLLSLVSDELSRAGIDPSRLGFEVTETAMIADMAQARWFIASLRELGCRVSLDDFGTGFSSFSYLKNLPVNCVKIDGSFVRGLAYSEDDRCLIRGIREMCHGLGVEVLAECVEDEATLEAVVELGLEYAQGYYVGRPTPVADCGVVER